MTLRLLITAVVVVLACGLAGTARAGGAATTIVCADGQTWVLDPAVVDVATFGEALCLGDFDVVLPAASASADDPVSDEGTGGIDVGLGADSTIDPDPSLYGTEVLCPDGSIWAVPIGESFVCPGLFVGVRSA